MLLFLPNDDVIETFRPLDNTRSDLETGPILSRRCNITITRAGANGKRHDTPESDDTPLSFSVIKQRAAEKNPRNKGYT